MKTLLALITAGALVSSTPQVVEEKLSSINFYQNNVISLNWHLKGGETADLEVFYQIRSTEGKTVWLYKPFKYHQDLNDDGNVQEREIFRYDNK